MALLCFASTPTAWAQQPQKILRAADQARGNLEGITWTVTITSNKKDKASIMALDVKSRGFDIVAISTAPPKYKGNKLIMLNGNMWFYKPGLSKPVPISRRLKNSWAMPYMVT